MLRDYHAEQAWLRRGRVLEQDGLGLTVIDYKRNLGIVQQERDGTTLRRWRLTRAWPVKSVAGEWGNEANENLIESVTLT